MDALLLPLVQCTRPSQGVPSVSRSGTRGWLPAIWCSFVLLFLIFLSFPVPDHWRRYHPLFAAASSPSPASSRRLGSRLTGPAVGSLWAKPKQVGEVHLLEMLLTDQGASQALGKWAPQLLKAAQEQAGLLSGQLGMQVKHLQKKAVKEASKATQHLQRTAPLASTQFQREAAKEASKATQRLQRTASWASTQLQREVKAAQQQAGLRCRQLEMQVKQLQEKAGDAVKLASRSAEEALRHQLRATGQAMHSAVEAAPMAAKEAAQHLQRIAYQAFAKVQGEAGDAVKRATLSMQVFVRQIGGVVQRHLHAGGQALRSAVKTAPAVTINLPPWNTPLTINLALVALTVVAILLLRFVYRTVQRGFEDSQVAIPGVRRLKHEDRCRELMQQMFDQPFIKARPPWLVNPHTGRALELDIYSETLQLAVEYDGEQHAKFTQYFHRDHLDFLAQKQRDRLKDDLCKKHGVTLVRVPSSVHFPHLEEFLKLQLAMVGRLPPSLNKDVLRALEQWKDSLST
eukprot:GGOE01001587.1.p1 GENE.GGOE01001587.1~~GGOE01001587.1.p1  ORF type:complete len:514 (+),score=131.08 GGOE01001587.1:43-1584(+)